MINKIGVRPFIFMTSFQFIFLLIQYKTVAAQIVVKEIKAKATYLTTKPDDSGAINSEAIHLAGYGLQAGDKIRIEVSGNYRFCDTCPETVTDLMGVFSRTNVLMDAYNQKASIRSNPSWCPCKYRPAIQVKVLKVI